MANATYQPKTYRDQGGNRINVVSGGTLNCESGSTITLAGTVANSGTETLSGTQNVTGTIAVGSAGKITQPVVAGSTVSNANYGITTVGSTGAKTYPVVAPVAGTEKTFFCTAGTTAAIQKLDAGAGVTWDGTKRYANLVAASAGLLVKGITTTRWFVVANLGSVTFTTD